MASIIAAGMMLPDVAKIKVVVFESPSSIPKGMASLSSRNGSIAEKKVINSGDKIMS